MAQNFAMASMKYEKVLVAILMSQTTFRYGCCERPCANAFPAIGNGFIAKGLVQANIDAKRKLEEETGIKQPKPVVFMDEDRGNPNSPGNPDERLDGADYIVGLEYDSPLRFTREEMGEFKALKEQAKDGTLSEEDNNKLEAFKEKELQGNLIKAKAMREFVKETAARNAPILEAAPEIMPLKQSIHKQVSEAAVEQGVTVDLYSTTSGMDGGKLFEDALNGLLKGLATFGIAHPILPVQHMPIEICVAGGTSDEAVSPIVKAAKDSGLDTVVIKGDGDGVFPVAGALSNNLAYGGSIEAYQEICARGALPPGASFKPDMSNVEEGAEAAKPKTPFDFKVIDEIAQEGLDILAPIFRSGTQALIKQYGAETCAQLMEDYPLRDHSDAFNMLGEMKGNIPGIKAEGNHQGFRDYTDPNVLARRGATTPQEYRASYEQEVEEKLIDIKAGNNKAVPIPEADTLTDYQKRLVANLLRTVSFQNQKQGVSMDDIDKMLLVNAPRLEAAGGPAEVRDMTGLDNQSTAGSGIDAAHKATVPTSEEAKTFLEEVAAS